MSASSCDNHPLRDAIGICVGCRRRICLECVTKVEGINYCVNCLSRLAKDADGHNSTTSQHHAGAFAVLSTFGLLAALTLMAWALVEVALSGGG